MNRWGMLALLFVSTGAAAGLLVTDLSGKAEIEGKGPVVTLAEIADGARLSLAPGAHLVAVDLASGREYVLNGHAQYVIGPDGPKTTEGRPVAAKPLPVRNLPEFKVAPGKVAQATLVMRSMRKFNVPVLQAPARTTVVTSRPVFQWSGVDGATSYRLIMKAEDGTSLWEVALTANEHGVAPEHSLAPGARYVWRIEALDAEGRTISDAAASFAVASAEVMARLAELKPATDAPFSRRVLYATQLRAAGASADAREVWKALSQERPDDAVLKLLAE